MMRIGFCLIAGVLCLAACNSDSATAPSAEAPAPVPYTPSPSFSHLGVEYMDLMNYRAELLKARGILSQQTCAMDLRVRSSLRDAVLSQSHDYNWFTSTEQYDAQDQKADQSWADDHIHGIQEQQLALQAALQQQGITASPWIDRTVDSQLAQFGFYPGFYDLNSYASYQVGPVAMPWYQPDGYVYKVFFEFKNPLADLTPDEYYAFSKQLHQDGFQGDSKIPLIPGWSRFLWNNLIVHAPTAASAIIAEKEGLTFFGGQLSSYSRGVDVDNPLTDSKATDWPDFLCSVDPSRIPAAILGYLHPTY